MWVVGGVWVGVRVWGCDLSVCTAIGVEVSVFLFGCLLCLLIVYISGFDVF